MFNDSFPSWKRYFFSWYKCIFRRHNQWHRKGNLSTEAVKLEEEEDDNLEKEKDESSTKVNDIPLAWRSFKVHLMDNILGDITKGMTTCSKLGNLCYHFAFVSQVEPKNAKDALIDENWLMAMQDELISLKVVMWGTLSHLCEIIKSLALGEFIEINWMKMEW